MSANQIPCQRLKLDDDWDKRPRPHACPTCRYMGGPGHTLGALLKLTRHEYDGNPVALIGKSTKSCSYWSARQQAHCKSTDQVQEEAGIGPRCPVHIS